MNVLRYRPTYRGMGLATAARLAGVCDGYYVRLTYRSSESCNWR